MVDRCTTVVNDSGEQVSFEQFYDNDDGSTCYVQHQLLHKETKVCSVPKTKSTSAHGKIQENSAIIKLSQRGFLFADKLWTQSTHHRNCTTLRQCIQTLLLVDNRLAIGNTPSELPCLPFHAWVLIFGHLKSTDFVTLTDKSDFLDVDVDDNEEHYDPLQPLLKRRMFQGAIYTIIRDPDNPPLSAADMDIAYAAVRSVVEGGAPIPRPTDKTANKKMWEYVTQQLGRLHTNPHVVNTIEKMIVDASCRNTRRQTWREVLSSHPKRPMFLKTFSKEEILKFVNDRDMKMVIHHRALDRFPGGNADMIIAKHEIVWKPNARGKLQPKITGTQFRNWDGSSRVFGQVDYPASACTQLEKKVIPAIINLLSNNNKNDDADDDDADDGDDDDDEANVLHECTVACAQQDSEDYNTEWSSIDICLYAPGDTDGDGDEPVLFTRVRLLDWW